MRSLSLALVICVAPWSAQAVEPALTLNARCAGVTIRAAMGEVADSPTHYAMHRQHDYWRARVAAETGDIIAADGALTVAVVAAQSEASRRVNTGGVTITEDNVSALMRAAYHEMVAECADARAALETQ